MLICSKVKMRWSRHPILSGVEPHCVNHQFFRVLLCFCRVSHKTAQSILVVGRNPTIAKKKKKKKKNKNKNKKKKKKAKASRKQGKC